MGCGMMPFETVPGWDFDPMVTVRTGTRLHGAVVIDKAGNIYTSASGGEFLFFFRLMARSFILIQARTILISMTWRIRDEEGTEFIYGVPQ